MKIIGGIYKGMNLYTPQDADIRPALARMKNSLFNILMGEFEDKKVLDLFAGTGSLGFEAISRGAKNCLFVENHQLCLESIRENISKLRLENVARVLLMDAFDIISYATKNDEKFDYIFIDPPYRYYDEKPIKEKLLRLIDDLAGKNIITQNGMIIVEHRTKQIKGDEFNNLEVVDSRDYGQTALSFLKRSKLTTKAQRAQR
ncbi:MAG: 16S rRNA (guanine(966)-N(2))-methyltransferase RsmD [Planctomycetota bacterium]